MNESLTKQLRTTFPNLLEKLDYIDVPDGWFKIIYSASELISSATNDLPQELKDELTVVQIKSKFGSLRYYLNKTTPYIDGVIHMAESMSAHTCEKCGSLGKQRNLGNWYMTVCDAHFEELSKTK